MAENSSSNTNNTLYFITGALVAIVAGLALMYSSGHMPGSTGKMSITIEAPKVAP